MYALDAKVKELRELRNFEAEIRAYITAIEDEKFYIFTHPESQVVAQPRVQRLASGINPKT